MNSCGPTSDVREPSTTLGVFDALWLPLDSLPVYESIPSTAERESWLHLLLGNAFDKCWADTLKHLESLGFYWNGTRSGNPIVVDSGAAPRDLRVPFFVAQKDAREYVKCECTASALGRRNTYFTGGAVSSAALDFFESLSRISARGEKTKVAARSPVPPVIFITFAHEIATVVAAFRVRSERPNVRRRPCKRR